MASCDEGAGLEPLGSGVGRGLDLGHVEPLQQIPPHVHRAEVRPVELVRRAHQQIAADRADVHQRVRRVVDRVDEAERAGVVREPGGGGHVGDRAEGIRRGADRQELRPRREGAFERVPLQLAGRGVHRHRADRQAAIPRDGAPRIDVAVMIQLGDDHLVARLPLARQGPAQVERQRRHVRAEGHLAGRRVEKICQRTARVRDARRPSPHWWGRPSACSRCDGGGSRACDRRRRQGPGCRLVRRSRPRDGRGAPGGARETDCG